MHCYRQVRDAKGMTELFVTFAAADARKDLLFTSAENAEKGVVSN